MATYLRSKTSILDTGLSKKIIAFTNSISPPFMVPADSNMPKRNQQTHHGRIVKHLRPGIRFVNSLTVTRIYIHEIME